MYNDPMGIFEDYKHVDTDEPLTPKYKLCGIVNIFGKLVTPIKDTTEGDE